MKKKVLKTIKEHELLDQKKKTAVVLGLSGGPDSLALLDCLSGLAKDYKKTKGKFGLNIEIYPVHVNHKFRPGAAEEDQKFVETYTKELSKENRAVHPVKTFTIYCNVLAEAEGLTAEEAGRKARYDAFSKVANRLVGKGKHTVIAVAQNANDQAETILFRIIRGTGIEGLSGIAYKRMHEIEKGTSVPVIRPLLDVSRSEIESYIKERNLTPCHDFTNDETVYTRNKIRLELIPELKKFNPNIIKTINRLGQAAALENDFMEMLTAAVIPVAVVAPPKKLAERLTELKKPLVADKFLALDCNILPNVEKIVRFRIYKKALESIGMAEGVTSKSLEAIEKIRVSEKHKMPTAEIPGGFTVVRIKHKLVFLSQKH